VINGEDAIRKRFYRDSEGVRLQGANAGMVPPQFPAEGVQIVGVFTGVLRVTPAG
jgi:SOS-response transcriptional repressor LexA